jgi:hypothetical protein
MDVAFAVAGQFRPEIIDSNEQDVWSNSVSGGHAGQRQRHQDRQ